MVPGDILTPKNDPLQELNRVRRELSILYEVSNAMRTTLELDHVLHIILTGVTAHTGLGFNRAILFLVNQTTRTLEPKMAIGPESGVHAAKVWDYISQSKKHMDDLIDKDAIKQNAGQSSFFNSIKDLKISLASADNSILVKVFTDGAPLHITREQIHRYINDPLINYFKTNELIIMPLRAKDKVNGLIVADNLYTQKPITDEDLRIFVMLANQAGLAIENSQLYELIKHKSHSDSLTDLWNHGFFQYQLTKEIDAAQEKKTPTSLIIMDIDNFKKLNDTYGHQVGDEILIKIADLLRESSRASDFVCRYGGEEFAVILPQSNKEQSYMIAERIRQRVEQTPFTSLQLNVTVSVGLATIPDDTQSKDELIVLADKAMYQAKFGGKNQICTP